MKHLILALLLTIPLSVFSQKKKNSTYSDWLITAAGDKIECHISSFGRAGGQIGKITYLDKDNVEQKIEGKEVQSIYIDELNILLEYTPINAHKPDKYKRHQQAMAYGKVKVYFHNNIFVTTNRSGKREVFYTETPTYNHIVLLDDGNYYDVTSKKDMQDVVIPYLMKCKAVANKYKEINRENIDQAARLYNENCGEEASE